jgi:hypothetical protein
MRPLHAVEPTAREGVASSDFPTSPDSLRAARSAQATQALLAERDADRKGDQGERGGAAAKSESVVRHVRVPHADQCGNGSEKQQESDYPLQRGAQSTTSGVLLLDEGHSGHQGSAPALVEQLCKCRMSI